MTGKKIIVPIEELIPVIQMQLAQGGKAPLQVTGDSMYPMLHHGKDSVLLEPVGNALRKGDLIFYRRDNGAYILHRIVKVCNAQTLTCCGDNQFEPERVETRQVMAIVTGFTRNGKQYTSADTVYRLYVWLWTGTFFCRKSLLALRRRLGRLRRRLQRRKRR